MIEWCEYFENNHDTLWAQMSFQVPGLVTDEEMLVVGIEQQM